MDKEAWWAAETEGEGDQENKALRPSAIITQQKLCKIRGLDYREWSGRETKEKERWWWYIEYVQMYKFRFCYLLKVYVSVTETAHIFLTFTCVYVFV